jgi:uncharacterized protein
MRALLDVNGLIALIDEEHVHHDKILAFLTAPEHLAEGFATCGITQLGAIRVMSGKGYYRPIPSQEIALHLERLTRRGHRYLGIPEPCSGAIRWKSTPSAQSTDATLLATAVAYGCRLVTFDTGISLAAASGARREHLLVLQ